MDIAINRLYFGIMGGAIAGSGGRRPEHWDNPLPFRGGGDGCNDPNDDDKNRDPYGPLDTPTIVGIVILIIVAIATACP